MGNGSHTKKESRKIHAGRPQRVIPKLRVTTADIAELLGYHPDYVRKLIREDKLCRGYTVVDQLRSIIDYGIEAGRF